jgi:RNA ligase
MKYKFPKISNIKDVLPAIENSSEFIVTEKEGGYTVINYMVSTDKTFPPAVTEADAIRRECRGMIFHTKTGNILHRRLHKFFNVNERDETQVGKIDFSQPHVILEKLDGSMITPVFTDAGIRWGTKMGVTDVALPVEEFIVDHPQFVRVAKYCHKNGMTPIFEWCSRKQRIVVDYPEDKLVLIAVRWNDDGNYMAYDAMTAVFTDQLEIPIVKQYPGTVESMQHLIDSCKDLTEAEGFVVRFDDGHMVKVKGEWYLQLHKAKDAIRFEKNIIELILTEKIDDTKAFLLDKDRACLEAYQEKFWLGVLKTTDMLESLFASGRCDDKKNFAVNFVLRQERNIQGFLFEMYKGRKAFDVLKEVLLLNCGSQTKVDSMRWIHNSTWNVQTE